MDLDEGRPEDVRERRGGGEGVQVRETAAPGGEVVAGLQGSPERKRASTVHGMRGIPDRDEVRDEPQRRGRDEQQVKQPLRALARPLAHH
jgi:hypothetical protein